MKKTARGTTEGQLPRVVIVGGGFGGMNVARALRKRPVTITLVDRRNHHLFQPLLYQVATAGLSPANIAVPIRSIVSRQSNTEVLMAEVTGVNTANRQVVTTLGPIPYDLLVLATGAGQSYFGHPEWEAIAPGLKTLDDATRLRRRILLSFERAEAEKDPAERAALLRFVVVGGGPTGVEMAGAIAELAHFALARDFRHIDPTHAEVVLIEAGKKLLSSFPEKLSKKAWESLRRLNVLVKLGGRVNQVTPEGVAVNGDFIRTRTVVWAAGVQASPAAQWLGVESDSAGRVKVLPDLTVPGHPEIFVIGDTARVEEGGKVLPGVAPVAMQQGKYVASVIKRRLRGDERPADPFHYWDKGSLATIGRSSAVVDIGKIRLSGFLAWLTWLVVHIFYLIGFRNRVIVMVEWAYAYFTFGRGARLITEKEG